MILEKVTDIALINKLHIILLMEEELNFHKKLIFGKRMRAKEQRPIPGKQYSKKECMAEDGRFDKILQANIYYQKRQCTYGYCLGGRCTLLQLIPHALITTMFLCLRAQKGVMATILPLIKFFLRTGSTTFIAGDIMRILHRMCQGNEAAPRDDLRNMRQKNGN